MPNVPNLLTIILWLSALGFGVVVLGRVAQNTAAKL